MTAGGAERGPAGVGRLTGLAGRKMGVGRPAEEDREETLISTAGTSDNRRLVGSGPPEAFAAAAAGRDRDAVG